MTIETYQQIDKPLYPALSVEVTPQPSKRTVWRILFTVGVLFILVNATVYWVVLQFDARNRMQNFTLIDLLEEPVDVLILGDSGVATGINPSVIEAETNLKALNLSLNAGWTYYNDVWVLEYYLERFGAPDAIIWGHAYDNNHFTFNPVSQLSGVTHFHGFENNSRYVTPNMTLEDQFVISWRRLFPLYYRDRTIDTLIDRLVSNQRLYSTTESLVMTKGFSAKTEINTRIVEADARSQTLRPQYEFSDDNLRVIDIFLDLIETYDIPTYVVITPVHRWIGEDEQFLRSTHMIREFWDEKDREYEQLDYNAEISMFDAPDMLDSDHLNVYGAEVYTRYLVDWIWGSYEPATLSDIYEKR